ncbi:MAG: fumarate hydratase [Candidatus Omnitrophota bacterium]|nr:fumarate hydratase [Candidatus Omnitrophota bacterium]
MAKFKYQDPFPLAADDTPYRLLTKDYIRTEKIGGREVLHVDPQALTILAREAFSDVSFYLRTAHLAKVAAILDDPEASDNDRFVALTLLQNAVVAAKGELPSCQDTGTAVVYAKKGEGVWTNACDEESLSQGIYETYQQKNLRYSQMIPMSFFNEINSATNLPAQIDIHSVPGNEYRFLFLAKGGGSANKTFLYQMSKSLLNEKTLADFLADKLFSLGTAACPPYHIAVVIGGTSAEATLKAVKLASAGYYDELPTAGNEGGQAFRDPEWEKKVMQLSRNTGIGAQFGGKYLAHDIRVVRLPRHAASCPVGLGVSCSADRNIKAKITAGGIYLEELDKKPERFLPAKQTLQSQAPVAIDLDRPMKEILGELSQYPVKTRLALNGTLIVARDVAHARIKKMLDEGKPMPEYLKQHPIYYAGPAKTPAGMVTGSFGPTTAGRMDVYVDEFMSHGGSMIMLAKGNRSPAVSKACKKYGGFYVGSVGGPAAILAKENIKAVEIVDFEELGMEAVRKIQVKDFPAFIVCDDKGNDFFASLRTAPTASDEE